MPQNNDAWSSKMLIRYAHKTSILINKNDYGSCCNVAT